MSAFISRCLLCFWIISIYTFGSSGYVFDVNYSFKFRTNYTGYTQVFLQRDVNDYKLWATVPKRDWLNICSSKHANTETCNGYELKDKNSAGYELLGAAIDGGDTVGDTVYLCSPRFIRVTSDIYRTNGRCFASNRNEFTPIYLLNNPHQVQKYNSSYDFLYSHGQAGFSIKYIKGAGFIAGAPGVLSWKGSFIKYTNQINILNPERLIDKNSYLGYSIESTIFNISTRTPKRYVFAGAPRGDNLLGQVYIFDYDHISNPTLRILKGDQISGYYGSTLLAMENYLFVGAPMYKTKFYEEGCVFIYGTAKGDLEFNQKICGSEMGGRFGTAIANLGFFDEKHSHPAIAISAPYADGGAGVVFTFVLNGDFREIQRICGKSISSSIRGFGVSLSSGIDVDGNQYNDIAIGSLFAEHVIILRSRKVLRFSGFFPSINSRKIGNDTKNSTLDYCFCYEGRKDGNNSIKIDVIVESDNRAMVVGPNRTLETLIGTVLCISFDVILKAHAFDSPLPLKITVMNKLAVCPDCPVAYTENTTQIAEIPFVTGCGNDDVCTPDLMLFTDFTDNVTELILGSRESISLLVSVSNQGETAYLTKLNITSPAEIRQFPVACSKEDNIIQCDVSNRLMFGQEKQLRFDFDVKSLNPILSQLRIDLTVGSTGSGNGTTATFVAILPVILKSDVTLIGFSNPEYLEIKDGINFAHEYVIFNNGPSPVLSEILEFRMPQGVTSTSGANVDVFSISALTEECLPFEEETLSRKVRDALLLERAPNSKYHFDCENNSLVTCKTYKCTIGELAANATLKYKFMVEIRPTLLYKVLGEDIANKALFSFESAASSSDNLRKHKASTHTILFRIFVESSNIWIWIVAAVVGSVIILSIVIVVLYKLHFFKRPIRDKLKFEESKNERECIIAKDASDNESADVVFSDIKF